MLNENAVYRPGGNCTPLTKEKLQLCTYFQSYQYGTATKAVRAVPVVHYSSRVANMFMGYVNYTRESKRNGPRKYDDMGYPLVKVDLENPNAENGHSQEEKVQTSERYYYVHRVSFIHDYFIDIIFFV